MKSYDGEVVHPRGRGVHEVDDVALLIHKAQMLAVGDVEHGIPGPPAHPVVPLANGALAGVLGVELFHQVLERLVDKRLDLLDFRKAVQRLDGLVGDGVVGLVRGVEQVGDPLAVHEGFIGLVHLGLFVVSTHQPRWLALTFAKSLGRWLALTFFQVPLVANTTLIMLGSLSMTVLGPMRTAGP